MASIRKRTPWRVVVDKDVERAKVFITQKQAEAGAAALTERGVANVKVERVPGGSWEARIRCKLAPSLVKTFRLKTEAEQWVKEREGEIAKRQFVDYAEADRNTLGDLFRKFDLERLVGLPRSHPDKTRIRMLIAHPFSQTRMSALQSYDIARYRDERLSGECAVKGTTVSKELAMISMVIGVARTDWGVHLAINPASGSLVSRPEKQEGDERDRRLADVHVVARPPSKRPIKEPGASAGKGSKPRRLTHDDAFENDPETDALLSIPHSEQQALLRACRYPAWFTQRKREVTTATLKRRAKTKKVPVKARLRPGCRIWAITSFAIETAMRRGEMCRLSWSHVHLKQGYLDLPWTLTKNKKPRIVPLSLRAQRILATQPRVGDLVFDTTINAVKLAFSRARTRVGSVDLRLHDLRHEATSRLFERTTLRENEIGYVTGHTDRRMLERYYNKRPEEFVGRFKDSFK